MAEKVRRSDDIDDMVYELEYEPSIQVILTKEMLDSKQASNNKLIVHEMEAAGNQQERAGTNECNQ